jgi:hypothetical protein
MSVEGARFSEDREEASSALHRLGSSWPSAYAVSFPDFPGLVIAAGTVDKALLGVAIVFISVMAGMLAAAAE